MSNQGKDTKCQFWCWAIAALAGVLIFIILQSVAGKSFMAALILGLIAFGLLGLLFNWLFCAPVPTMAEGRASKVSTGAAAVSSGTAHASAPTTKTAQPSEAPKSSDAPKSSEAKASGDTDSSVDSSASSSTTAPEATGKSADAVTSAVPSAKVMPSAALAGEEDLAARKGEYKYEAPAVSESAAAEKGKAASKAKPDGKSASKGKATAASKSNAKSEATKAAEAAATPDYDGDGTREGTDEGRKPSLLTAARSGGADDLKRIKGIGPKLEGVCNEIGVYHFDQIAAWSADEIAWVNANLIGFKGRVTRDQWVDQAKLLAAGEETEFSKRVDKGSVY